MPASTPPSGAADSSRDGNENDAETGGAEAEDTSHAGPTRAPDSDVLRTEIQALIASLNPPDDPGR
jgi:hypothetical protein